MKSFRTMGVAATALAASQISFTLASIEDPSVQRTPPMGFNNWARFECALNESLFVATADAMARNGMRDAGYEWINIDDCWLQHTRGADGRLRWNETLFPRGLVWLGEYIKARGFRFGIYEDAGNATCGGYPGSQGHEQLDAQTFQEWGIEYLKLDGCNVDPGTEEQYYGLYDTWHRIFSAMKNPFVFSESAPAYFSGTNNNTDWYRVMDWVPRLGELARHSTDIAVYDYYGNDSSKYWDSIMTNYGFEVLLARYQRPGYHNDPDFIIADWPQLTLDEKKSHFALWSSFSAPLIVSSYIPDLTADELAYLTNRAIIAVDQDALSLQATLVSQDGRFDVLTKSLANGDRLLTVLNRGANTASTTVDLARVGLNRQSQYTFTDLWSGSASKHSGSIKITLPTHATAIYRISGVKSVTPTGMIFNTASNKCLTAASRGSGVGFATCAGTDAQVWTVTNGPRGAVVRPLSQPTTCLTANGGKGVSLQRCSGASKNSGWTYAVTGNLMIAGTSTCLQETASGGAALATCGDERDSQVFGLPSGVDIRWS